jgi:hypothetical protein
MKLKEASDLIIEISKTVYSKDLKNDIILTMGGKDESDGEGPVPGLPISATYVKLEEGGKPSESAVAERLVQGVVLAHGVYRDDACEGYESIAKTKGGEWKTDMHR